MKERAAEKRKARQDASQPAFNDESLLRMEKMIGQPLPRLAPGETPHARLPTPGKPAEPSDPS